MACASKETVIWSTGPSRGSRALIGAEDRVAQGMGDIAVKAPGFIIDRPGPGRFGARGGARFGTGFKLEVRADYGRNPKAGVDVGNGVFPGRDRPGSIAPIRGRR